MISLNDSEKYVYSYLNSKSSTLSFYVSRLLKNNISLEEKKNLIQSILDIVNDIETLIFSLGIVDIPINEFFNQLYLLKDINVPRIDYLLTKYSYQSKIDNGYIDILRSISLNDVLTPEQKLLVEFLINNHLLDNEESTYEYFIGNVLLKPSQISFESFANLFVDYIRLLMSEYIENPICILISDRVKPQQHMPIQNEVLISREDVQRLYHQGIYKVIKDAFHDIGHVKQYNEIMQGNSNGKTIRLIKDAVLTSEIPKYYDSNQEVISYEVDAEFFALMRMVKLFDKLGLGFKSGKNPYYPQLIELLDKSKKYQRIVGEKEEDIDVIFNFVILHHPEYLEIYPQLAQLYKVSYGNLVVSGSEGRKE